MNQEQIRERLLRIFGKVLNDSKVVSTDDRVLIRACRAVLEIPGGVSEIFIECVLQQMG